MRHKPCRIDPAESHVLVRRAFRLRRRGEHRRSMLLLREACNSEPHAARLWIWYGLACVKAGRRDAALEALRHAAWLRERERDPRRAEVTRSVALSVGV